MGSERRLYGGWFTPESHQSRTIAYVECPCGEVFKQDGEHSAVMEAFEHWKGAHAPHVSAREEVSTT